ncbi:MAG: trypsin-like peptidase domain-containing protein [Verrucomicrobiaceae bacterium]|nr:trypsin-like peptidase domain-containing protein [Verrucomicrobiaceae bacterium]
MNPSSRLLKTVQLMLSIGAIFAAGLWVGSSRNKPAVNTPPALSTTRGVSTQEKAAEQQALQTKRRLNTASIAALFQVEEAIAEELLKEYEMVREQHRQLTRDGMPENDPRDVTTFYIQSLGKRAEANPILQRWLAGRPGSFIGESLWGESAIRRREKGALPDFLLAGKYGSSGTGFFVSPDGWLVTNAHVVGQRQQVDIRGVHGLIQTVRVVKADAKADLALLKCDSPSPGFLDVRGEDLPLGTRVFTIGFPNIDTQGVQAKFTEGSISSLAGWRDDPNDYQISVPLQQGNSGGALVDTNTGLLAGVVISSLAPSMADNVGYAIKASVLARLIRSTPECAGISLPAYQASSRDRAENIDRANKSSVMVLVR